MQIPQEVSVGGIGVVPFKGVDHAVSAIVNEQGVMPGFAIAINPEKVMAARSDQHTTDVLNSATLRFADGIAVVKTLRKKGFKNRRVPGVELWEKLMSTAAEKNLRVLLLGASPEVNLATADKLKNMGVNIVQSIHGYEKNEQVFVDALTQHKPHIVTVAMGSPRQEKLISKLRPHHPDAFYMGVGGTYDVFTNNVKRAPAFFCKIHLEWLYRLCCQPSRFKRQLPLFKYAALHYLGRL